MQRTGLGRQSKTIDNPLHGLKSHVLFSVAPSLIDLGFIKGTVPPSKGQRAERVIALEPTVYAKSVCALQELAKAEGLDIHLPSAAEYEDRCVATMAAIFASKLEASLLCAKRQSVWLYLYVLHCFAALLNYGRYHREATFTEA